MMDSGASSSGRHKRKRRISGDADSNDDVCNRGLRQSTIGVLAKGCRLFSEPIDNEYEDLDENEGQETAITGKAEYEQILRAQEPTTISQYDDIKITPFNLTEELEEGEFDESGNFIPSKKESEDENNDDTWAESVDWSAIGRKERESKEANKVNNKPSQSVPDKSTRTNIKEQNRPGLQIIDWITCYKQMMRIMRPDETVQKTIRRLGNSVPKRRLIKSKASNSNECLVETGDLAEVAEAKRKLDSMIELAHQRLEDGDTDIYQKSYEDLEEAIN